VPADRDHDEVGLGVLADEAHVAEEARVTHVVDLEAVLHLDEKAQGSPPG